MVTKIIRIKRKIIRPNPLLFEIQFFFFKKPKKKYCLDPYLKNRLVKVTRTIRLYYHLTKYAIIQTRLGRIIDGHHFKRCEKWKKKFNHSIGAQNKYVCRTRLHLCGLGPSPAPVCHRSHGSTSTAMSCGSGSDNSHHEHKTPEQTGPPDRVADEREHGEKIPTRPSIQPFLYRRCHDFYRRLRSITIHRSITSLWNDIPYRASEVRSSTEWRMNCPLNDIGGRRVFTNFTTAVYYAPPRVSSRHVDNKNCECQLNGWREWTHKFPKRFRTEGL